MNETIMLAMNEQVSQEFNVAFLYLSFSVDVREYGLRGVGHWLRQQYFEEFDHALRLIDYLELCGATVVVPTVDKIFSSWKNPVQLFEIALTNEQSLRAHMGDLISLCVDHQDYASQDMLFTLVREQVKKEKYIKDIIHDLQFSMGSIDAMMRVDDRLAMRPVESIRI